MRLGVLALAFAQGYAVLAEIVKDFRNVDVTQEIDLTLPYVRARVEVEARNIADGPVSDYAVPIRRDSVKRVAAIEALDSDKTPLAVHAPVAEHDDIAFYLIHFPSPIESGDTVKFAYTLALTGILEPLPLKAAHDDTQFLLYEGSSTVLSAYDTESEKTLVKTLSQNVVDLQSGQKAESAPGDGKYVGGILAFGPFEKVGALKETSLRLKFENPLAVIEVTHLARNIWISHWGDAVSFDESFDVYNAGTQLSHPFSRLDYSKLSAGKFNLNTAAIRNIRIPLPKDSKDLYFVDLVGNVSTSRVTPVGPTSFLDLQPRYPVMGGWRYNFTVGWTNSLGTYVHDLGNHEYLAAIPLLFGPDDVSYGEVSTKIVLPEGAKNIKFFDNVSENVEDSLVYSYLDLQGRPAIELKYTNLLDVHRNNRILVSYEYSTSSALAKPLLFSSLLFGAFLVGYFYSQINWSI